MTTSSASSPRIAEFLSAGTGRTILLLDDERPILDVLVHHLRKEGYGLTATISPAEAIDSLDSQRYDLLLTDLKMPGINGLEVVQRFKEADPDISIVVITAMTEVSNAIQAMRAGADDYVLKPFNLAEISLCVQRALEKRDLIIENRQHQTELESRVREATLEIKHAHRELQETKDYLESLIHSTVDAIVTIDPNEQISFANRGAVLMLGYPEADLRGVSLADIYVGGIEEARYIRRVTKEDRPLQNYETEFKHKNGKTIPVSMSISLVPGPNGTPHGMLAVCKDITEQKRLERELKEMTIRDSLTGLYNQRHFYDRLEAEVERAKRQNRPLSLLLVDIDCFKSYNDSHGHLEGDRVLQAVGEVLRECTREHVDLAFRYGGDEFTAILPEAAEDTALRIAERIRTMFEEKRFDLLTMSIGLMAYRGQDIRKFIQFTDSMMYDAKRAGGNRVYVYNPGE